MAKICEGIDNPFQDWWETDNPEWLTVRKQQWPFVAQYLRRTLSHHASRDMSKLRDYFLYGKVALDPDPPWHIPEGRDYPLYIDAAARLVLTPWKSAADTTTTIDTYVYDTGKDQLHVHGILLRCDVAIALNLPMEKFDDPGLARQALLSEGLLPKSFGVDFIGLHTPTPERIGDAANHQVESYETWVHQYFEGAEDADNQPLLMIPCEALIDYYLLCYETLENVSPADVRKPRLYNDQFLTSVFRFEERFPVIGEEDARRDLAIHLRQRLQRADVPKYRLERLPEIMEAPMSPVKPKKRRKPNPHAHLKFYRGSGKFQYSGREVPDSEYLVGSALILNNQEERDRVLFMTQELNEESITKFQEFHSGKPVETPDLDNPVYQQSRKWFGS